MDDLHVREATADDLPAVRAIYNHYVATSTCTFQVRPETEDERREWFAARTPEHPAVVAVLGGEVVGWGSLSPWNKRCAYERSVEASVYVRDGLHRRGIGLALLTDLIARARAAGHHTVIGGACTEQAPSLALQDRLGFTRVACFREVGHKFGRWLDVAYMQLMLDAGGG